MEPAQPIQQPAIPRVGLALGEVPAFLPGEHIQIGTRMPIGRYRVPLYLRGKRGVIVAVIKPAWLNNEEEGFGRNAGGKRHYYRIAFSMQDVWPGYSGPARDRLLIEVFETWLERA